MIPPLKSDSANNTTTIFGSSKLFANDSKYEQIIVELNRRDHMIPYSWTVKTCDW